jgi:hypothetical protein
MLDYAVIVPRLQRLYEWSAEELDEPRLLGVVRDGSPTYAWPYEKRNVWRALHMPFTAPGCSNASRRLADAAAAGPNPGLARFEEDAVSGADHLDRRAAALAVADALEDVDRLAVRVGVPGGARAGCGVDVARVQPRGRGWCCARVDVATGPGGRRALSGCW